MFESFKSFLIAKFLILWPYLTLQRLFLSFFIFHFIKYAMDYANGIYINKVYTQKIWSTVMRREKGIKLFVEKYKVDLNGKQAKRVLNASALELAKMVRTKQVSSALLVKIFAARIHQKESLNLYADCDFDYTLELAVKKDKMVKDGKKLPPFHGVPMSIKDCIPTKNFIDTAGYSYRLFSQSNPQKEDAPCVKVLMDAGIIPLIKSNVPVGLACFESVNNIWGLAQNPWNPLRSIGGSSGGEAGLIASQCSPLGIGTDVGGSIRVPASFGGVYGFKPTSFRTSAQKILDLDGEEVRQIHQISYDHFHQYLQFNHIPVSVGPLGKTVEDLKTLIECSFNNISKYDPYVANVQFDNSTYDHISSDHTKLKIGYFPQDEFIGISPAIKNTLEEVKTYLVKQGHTVTAFPKKSLQTELSLYGSLIAPEKLTDKIKKALRGEYLLSVYQQLEQMAMIPDWLWTVANPVLRLLGQKRLAKITEFQKNQTFKSFGQKLRKREIMKAELVKIWKDNQYDAIIMPVSPMPATLAGKTADVVMTFSTAFFPSFYDLPAGVVPIRLVKEDEQHLPKKQYSKPSKSNIQRHNDKIEKDMRVNIENSKGLPTCIQVVGLTQEDEKVLGVMKRLERHFDFFKKYNQI